jgi:hypothetical protein
MSVVINGTSGITTPGLDASGTNKFASTIAVGGTTPAATGAGVTFPAIFNASSDANTLDDYEEGTWTPYFYYGNGVNGTTQGNTSARYIKVGKQVTVWFYINQLSKNGGTGQLYVASLPFTSAPVIGAAEGASLVPNFWNNFASVVIPGGYVQYNNTTILLINTDATTSVAGLNASSISDTANLYGCATYFTA